MQRFHKSLLVAFACVAFTGSVCGFSLQGPLAPWQTDRLGYNLNFALFGGPMALTEEYRWGTPNVYYAFTPEFTQYFGERGVEEVEKVFALLNELPAASQINLEDAPLRSARANFQAAALGLIDVRSQVLSVALESIGLADSTRFVYTLRGREPLSNPDITNYYVIRRSYDPDTWRTSPYINGVLWTYTFVGDVSDTESFCFTDPVDPLASLTSAYPVSSRIGAASSGSYWTTLTRDDMGGIHYVYREDNYNIETLAPTVSYLAGGVWGAPPGSTNAAGTNLLVTTGLRPGRDSIRFHRADFDSLFGYYVPFTNRYEDTYITNGGFRKQTVERALTAPDILFHAADTLGGITVDGALGAEYIFTTWTYGNTNAQGGTNFLGSGVNLGPGTINPGGGAPAITYTFNTVHDLWINTFPFDNQDEITAARITIWGSFDGTTNEPFVYPVGIEARDVESWVLSGRSGDPWGAPPNSGVVTNNPGTGTGTTP